MTRRRFYEILPGALIWTTLISAILLSFIKPLWMVAFIILFDFYWLLRILYFIPFLITAWRRYRVAAKTDWQQKLEGLAHEEKIHHLIFLPTYKESYEVIRETLLCLTRASYPVSRMSIVLGGEAREEDVFLSIAQRIQEEFQPVFAHFL
jgi:cellulose synthase/poly-beta-1,6-N-acetylglucosamine synthase-like glycosyltransferase